MLIENLGGRQVQGQPQPAAVRRWSAPRPPQQVVEGHAFTILLQYLIS